MKNLVIVESPAKAKTIEKFLGKDYKVMSSYGHIRDLRKKDISIETDGDFEPVYEIPEDKKALVAELKKAAKMQSEQQFEQLMMQYNQLKTGSMDIRKLIESEDFDEAISKTSLEDVINELLKIVK